MHTTFFCYVLTCLTNAETEPSASATSAGKTPTVVDGSTFYMSGHATSSAALTNINLSSLFGSATPPAASDTSDISSSNTTPSMQAVTSSPTTANAEMSSTTTASTNDAANAPLSIGAIVGIVVGAVVGLLALVCVFLVWRRRGRSEPKKFDRGRGITPSMVLQPPMANTFAQHNLADLPHYLYPDKVDHYDDEQRPTSHTTAALDQMYKIKQYNTSDTSATIPGPPAPAQMDAPPIATTTTSPSTTRVVSQGARLSKYNYLAEAFTQMRASHIAQPAQSSEELRSYNTDHNYYERYPPQDPQQVGGTPPPPASKNNPNIPPAFMEPAPPVRTVSPPSSPGAVAPPAPARAQSSQSSLVPRITIYNENDEELPPVTGLSPPQSSPLYDHLQQHRVSLSSEVSQYSTPSNPFRFDSAPAKRYDYF
ncbi:hypothetical protein BCR43DRAFT_130455 [Syncephalastrum racemosum]|uniref:Mid2 domain-containing protein n=1 Tax=Syncephalastrum racemosum TaxID=13706 RepID=A0A1X2HL81_SYNRA|nr:hypothetical protein BCR43DRAFT_130455 [Syncephalastrum racemosum]